MDSRSLSQNSEISLVIPVRDEAETIHELLDSIRQQKRLPDEVVFVDGGSTDKTVSLLSKASAESAFPIKVIEAGPATPGRGRNIGIRAASFEWIALTDAGNRLEPDWLENLIAVVECTPETDVVYGNYEPVVTNFFERCAALTYPAPRQIRDDALMRGPFIASSLIRKAVWERVGGFPDLRAAEDLMFMEEVENSGAKIAWAPHATVWWSLRPDLRSTFRKFVLYSKHNVWAGRARYWHYGIARQYLIAIPFLIFGVLHSPWWFLPIALGLCARAAKSILIRREGHSLWWLLNPFQFLYVLLIVLCIDLATFVGWSIAILSRPATTQEVRPA